VARTDAHRDVAMAQATTEGDAGGEDGEAMSAHVYCKHCAAPVAVNGSTSDGYHTFDELYEHRVSLFIALCSEVDARTPTGYVWRSKLHSDGSKFDGWFVMGIGTQPGEQITYHLPLSRWDDTEWLGTEFMRAPDFDGHTSADVLQRLRRYFR
jgi:hypothetical protein